MASAGSVNVTLTADIAEFARNVDKARFTLDSLYKSQKLVTDMLTGAGAFAGIKIGLESIGKAAEAASAAFAQYENGVTGVMGVLDSFLAELPLFKEVGNSLGTLWAEFDSGRSIQNVELMTKKMSEAVASAQAWNEKVSAIQEDVQKRLDMFGLDGTARQIAEARNELQATLKVVENLSKVSGAPRDEAARLSPIAAAAQELARRKIEAAEAQERAKAFKEADKHNAKARELADELQGKIAKFGMSDVQGAIFDLAKNGIDDGLLQRLNGFEAQLRVLEDQKKAMEEQAKLQQEMAKEAKRQLEQRAEDAKQLYDQMADDAKRIQMETLSPVSKFMTDVEKARKLLSVGLIDLNTFESKVWDLLPDSDEKGSPRLAPLVERRFTFDLPAEKQIQNDPMQRLLAEEKRFEERRSSQHDRTNRLLETMQQQNYKVVEIY